MDQNQLELPLRKKKVKKKYPREHCTVCKVPMWVPNASGKCKACRAGHTIHRVNGKANRKSPDSTQKREVP
jgi:hypothetical protein